MVRRLWPEPADLTDEQLTEAYQPGEGPSVCLNMVSSVDGAATLDGRSGGLGSPADQLIMRRLRMHTDVILVGAGTVRAEGYLGALIGSPERRWRLERGRPEFPRLAVISRTGQVPVNVFADSPMRPLLITTAAARAGGPADVLVSGDDSVDLRTALTQLRGLGLDQVLSEGGPHLMGALSAEDLIDDMCLALSPVLAGPGAGRITAGPAAPPRRMALRHVLTDDALLFLRYHRA